MNSQAVRIDLLEHLLGQYWAYFDQGSRPELIPGEIAGSLPTEIPIPADSRIVGSVVWEQRQASSILFDCNLTRDQVVEFYDERLPSQGWTKPEMNDSFNRGGFTMVSPAREIGAIYCLGENGLSLHIRCFTLPDAITSVSVGLNSDPDQSPCSRRARRQYEQMGRFRKEMLPELRPPEGATQMGGGGSGGSGSETATSEAWLQTDLDIPATLSHYGEQLANAGWTRADTGHSGPMGWCSWDFVYEGENWRGLLTVTRRPWKEGEYTLRLYAEVEGYGRHSGIRWVSHF